MKIAIIGAGAAGCFAAANIPKEHATEVCIYEKSGKALQKVKVSGGGRCNVTHYCFDIPELLTRYPRGKALLKKTLYRFGPQQTIDWFEQRGVSLKTEIDGRIFPVSDDSQSIIDAIWKEMMLRKVQVFYHKGVTQVSKKDDKFHILFSDTSETTADKVIITSGGFPKPEQYNWLTALGHSIQPPAPSLFTFNIPKHPITALMGVSVPEAVIKIPGTKIRQSGPLLITHWGMSGPAVLKTSAYAARELAGKNYDFQAIISWLPEISEADLRQQIGQIRISGGKLLLHNKNPFELPKRLWEYMMVQCGISDDVRWGDLTATAQNKLITQLIADTYHINGKTTFKEEFVTCGGITISEIDAQTMQSRVVPGLYFAGEILDADGITGGYNFQHAWSSSWIAAHSVSLHNH